GVIVEGERTMTVSIRRKAFALVLIVLGATSGSAGTRDSERITASGTGLGGRKVSVNVYQTDSRAARRCEACLWWGASPMEEPRRVVASMRLVIDGTTVQAPRSCLAGLADVRELLLGSPEDSTFRIRGGETGEYYEALF